MAGKEFDTAAADAEAKVAEAELQKMDKKAVQAMFVWWNLHYMTAGHKRLYRTMKAVATSPDTPEVESATPS